MKRLEVEHYSDVTLSVAEMTDPEQAVGLDKKALFSFGAEFHSVPRPIRKVLPFALGWIAGPAVALHPPTRRTAHRPAGILGSTAVEKTARLELQHAQHAALGPGIGRVAGILE